LIEQW